MGMDPFFTSGYKKPRVNHKYDEGFAIFRALPPKEQEQIISKLFEKIRAKKRLTRKEYSLFRRWDCIKNARKHLARQHREIVYGRLARRNPVIGGFDSCGWQTQKPRKT